MCTEGVIDTSRQIPTFLTTFDLRKICSAASADTYTKSNLISYLRPRLSDALAGREFTFSFEDGSKLCYRFGKHYLEWSDGGAFNEEYAECLESARKNVFLVHHLKTDTLPYKAATLVIDPDRASVTLVDMKFGTKHSNRDVNRTVKMGVILGEGAPAASAHALTEDFTGVVMDWKYADDVRMHHMYENRSFCAFVSPPPPSVPEWKEFFITFNPTKYVKLADKLYLLSFCAPGSSGMEASMLIDMETMTCVGSVFGIDMEDALRCYTFGGKGAFADVGFVGNYTVQ